MKPFHHVARDPTLSYALLRSPGRFFHSTILPSFHNLLSVITRSDTAKLLLLKHLDILHIIVNMKQISILA